MPSLHLIGILQLGRGEYAEARLAFSNAEAMGVVRTEYHSATFAAERNLKVANETLARSTSVAAGFNPATEAARTMFEVGYALDGDQLTKAKERIAVAQGAASTGQLSALYYAVAALSIGVDEVPDAEYRKLLDRAVGKLNGTRKDIVAADKGRIDATALILAYLAARKDFKEMAGQLLASVAVTDATANDTLLYKLHVVVSAELKRSTGDVEGAISMLKSAIDGSELSIVHVALFDAYNASSRWNDAIKEADWLATHRGRAYAESNAMNLLTAFNVEQSTLALLRGAESALANGDLELARRNTADFLSTWPQLEGRPSLTPRVDRLRSQVLASGAR